MSFRCWLGFCFSHRPMPMARTMMPSSRNITCIWGLSLLAWAFARMSEDVPGTTTTFTPCSFSNAGNTYCVYAFSMVPPFMPMYSVLVCAVAVPVAATAVSAAAVTRARRGGLGERGEKVMVVSFLVGRGVFSVANGVSGQRQC